MKKYMPSVCNDGINVATATKTFTVITLSAVSLLSVAYTIFIVYLGVYAFNDPDPKGSFYVDGVDEVALTRESIIAKAGEESVDVKAGYPVDFGKVFRAWFMWGFWGSML